MTSAPVRNPVQNHLLTPQNVALVIIDYQPVQVSSVASRSKRELVANIVALARIVKLYGLPTVLANVNLKTGINQPAIHQITDDRRHADRPHINQCLGRCRLRRGGEAGRPDSAMFLRTKVNHEAKSDVGFL